MRTSPTPWSIRGNKILDQSGKLIGAMSDWRDAEKVVKEANFNYPNLIEELNDEIENLETELKNNNIQLD